MILYFMDRTGTVIGQASNTLYGGYQIVDDNKQESVETAAIQFDATITFEPESRLGIENLTKPGNYVLRFSEDDYDDQVGYTVEGVSDFFTIIEQEVNKKDRTIYFYAESGGLDLLNDLAGPYTPDAPTRIDNYINKALQGTQFELRGVTGVSDLKFLSWDSAETVTARLQSICSSFDCEMKFGFTVKGLSIVYRWLEIYKRIGKDTGKILTFNNELDNITVKRSINNLATALFATTADGITLEGYDPGDNDPDFFIDGGYLKTREGLANWFRFRSGREIQNGGYIFKNYKSDSAVDQASLYLDAKKKLTEYRESEVNYTINIIDFPSGINLGDRVNVVDNEGGIYISGRVLELKTSSCNRTKEATIGDYLIKSAGLSERLKAVSDVIHQEAEAKNASIDALSSNLNNEIMIRTKERLITSDTADKIAKGIISGELNAIAVDDNGLTMTKEGSSAKMYISSDNIQMLYGESGYPTMSIMMDKETNESMIRADNASLSNLKFRTAQDEGYMGFVAQSNNHLTIKEV